MSRYGQRTRLTGTSEANSINKWFGGGFAVLPISVEYLVIGGGGAGGGYGGGGGAGGYITNTFTTLLKSTNYSLKVGAGGVGAVSATGANGNTSIFSTITAGYGGGGGLGAGFLAITLPPQLFLYSWTAHWMLLREI